MNDDGPKLRDARILVLEDDYYLATDLQYALEKAGATVVGPFSDEAAAARSLASARPDCAFVDVNLGRGPTFGVPRALASRSVPFAFVTGYDAGTIPEEFKAVTRFEKPVDLRKVVQTAAWMFRRT